MHGVFLVTALSENKQFVFLTKIVKKSKEGSSSTKSRVKRVDTVITMQEQSHQLLHTRVINHTHIQTVYGNALQLLKVDINIIDDENKKKDSSGPQIHKQITLPSLASNKHSKQNKSNAEEVFEVAGYED